MDLLVYDDDERRYVPLPVAVAAALVLAAVTVLACGVSYVVARESGSSAAPSGDIGGVSPPEAGTAPSLQGEAAVCADALTRADAALELAAQLAERHRLLERRVAVGLPPSPLDGAADREQRLTAELAAYRAVRSGCPS